METVAKYDKLNICNAMIITTNASYTKNTWQKGIFQKDRHDDVIIGGDTEEIDNNFFNDFIEIKN